MAKAAKQTGDPRPHKLPRLPPNTKIQKRPLLHPPIASPFRNADTEKVVYVNVRTPFLSAVKRVQKLLSIAEKRAAQSALAQKRNRRADPIMSAAIAAVDGQEKPERVTIKATGRSIEKAMELALFFQQQEDCHVRLETGTVDAIDDLVEDTNATEAESKPREELDTAAQEKAKRDQVPETRIRHTSVLEVHVSLR
ncbi:Rpp20 subunit of nuclear RNase MRP and P-domain-containing protein [Phyllosticta citribraziliensis]|uniref:Rpp20 subunit of nuclear RNase MRP and P-domain-containing protein n=1 Tax=Phyllosticta citribraziliensis TaxID=989973 RepID=A0ABR1LPU5_9PEZI